MSRRCPHLIAPRYLYKHLKLHTPQKAIRHFTSGASSEADLGSFVELKNTQSRVPDTDLEASLSQRYGPLASHKDLDLTSLLQRSFLTKDVLNGIQSGLLKAALHNLLPADPYSSEIEQNWFHPGWQQIYFRPRLTPEHLLSDGTDTRFLPGPGTTWAYRLWAGGSVMLHDKQPPVESAEFNAYQHEYVEDIRIVGSDQPERVFVKVNKDISYDNDNGCDRKTKSEETTTTTGKLKQAFLQEQYTLCFLRSPPGATAPSQNQNQNPNPNQPSSLTTKSRKHRAAIRPPPNPTFHHNLTISSNLLFQFSALTHNAHAIHLDPTFARAEYKLQAPVVHGPFSQLLMLEFLRISLSRAAQQAAASSSSDSGSDNKQTHFVCRRFDYKNFAPLYVGEEMVLCCRPVISNSGSSSSSSTTVERSGREEAEGNGVNGSTSSSSSSSSSTSTWLVWIQVGHGDGASLAVRGTVEVEAVPMS